MNRSALAAALAAAVALAYFPVLEADFVSWDDPFLVTNSAEVRKGLTPGGFGWAMTAVQGAIWNPVTTLSHMLDVELFGLDPAGHHAMSVLLHLLAALLLFELLASTTGAAWPALLAACWFALHPLHVESVAWVSERKDVLSLFLGLLSARAYVVYARGGGAFSYAACLACFLLALMAKPMLFTLPLLFLLLDVWPLGRVSIDGPLRRPFSTAPAHAASVSSPWILVLEKVPMFVVAAACATASLLLQSNAGAMVEDGILSLWLRIQNAFVSTVWYLGKMLWPSHLAFFYPHPNLPGGAPLAWWQVAGAAMILVAISVAVVKARRRAPYALVGWLWYLIALAPVSGLVQVGHQARADRYTYLPSIGLCLAAAWCGHALLTRRWRDRLVHRRVAALVAAASVVALAVATHRQTSVWNSSRALYEHAIAVGARSPIAHLNLGHVLADARDPVGAAAQYRAALALEPLPPERARALVFLGKLSLDRGMLGSAIQLLEAALEARPESALAHYHLALARQRAGDLAGGERHARAAIASEPESRAAFTLLGNVLAARGDREAAIVSFRRALELAPDDPVARRRLDELLQRSSVEGGAPPPEAK